MTRYTVNGRDSWQARSGYRYGSDPNTPLVRDNDRPRLSLIEFGAVAVLVAAVTLLIVAFS